MDGLFSQFCILLFASAFVQSSSGQCKKAGVAQYVFQASTISSELAIKPSFSDQPSLVSIDISKSFPFYMLMRFYECSNGMFTYTLSNMDLNLCGANCLLKKDTTSLVMVEVSDASPDSFTRNSPFLFDYTPGLSIVESTCGSEGSFLQYDQSNRISFRSSSGSPPVWWSLPVAKVGNGVYLDPLAAVYCGDNNGLVSSAIDCVTYIAQLAAVEDSQSAGVEVSTILKRANQRKKRDYSNINESLSSRGSRRRTTRPRGHRRGHTATSRPFISRARDYVQEFKAILCERYTPTSFLFKQFDCEDICITTEEHGTVCGIDIETPTNKTTELRYQQMYIYDKPINETNGTNFFTSHEAVLINVPGTQLYLTTGEADEIGLATPDQTLPGVDGIAVPAFDLKFSEYPETRTRARTACGLTVCPFASPSRSGVPLSEQSHVDERFFKVIREGEPGTIRLESAIRSGFFLGFNTNNPSIPLVLAEQLFSIGIVFDFNENSLIDPTTVGTPGPLLQVPEPQFTGETEVVPQK